MNFRLYKPGQGYWMRVLTAAFFGVLVLAAAAWLWNESKAVVLPTKGYVVPVEGLSENIVPTPGETLVLEMENPEPGGPERLTVGRGSIASIERTAAGANITTGKLTAEPGREIFDATRFIITPASGAPYEVRLYGNMQPIAAFDALYLQAGLACVVIVVGSLLLFYYVAVNPRTGEFLITTDGEMKKVNWSSRKEVVGSTWVVVTTCFLLAGALFVVDLCFRWFFTVVGVLDRL